MKARRTNDRPEPPQYHLRGACCMRGPTVCFVLLATLVPALAEPIADFTRLREFEAQYAYLNVPQGAPVQDWIAISARRVGGGWRVDAVGSNPKLAASVRTCRKTFGGRTIGPGRLRATDPSGEFGSFELRLEGEYVRLVSLVPGGCEREGLYLVPSVTD